MARLIQEKRIGEILTCNNISMKGKELLNFEPCLGNDDLNENTKSQFGFQFYY